MAELFALQVSSAVQLRGISTAKDGVSIHSDVLKQA